MRYELVSADDHVDLCYISPTLWQDRLPARWREQAPRVAHLPAGPTWVREGRPWGIYGSKRADGRKVVFDVLGLSEEVEPGVWRATSPRHRLEDMDRDGVHAQVMYNFLDWSFTDQQLKTACLQAFNSWLADDLCAADRDRLVGLPTLPTQDSTETVKELRRVMGLGLRGAIFDVFGAVKPIFDREWEPLWAAAEESGAVLSVHIGGGLHTLSAIPRGRNWSLPARASISCMQLEEVLVALVFSGVLERHPRIRVVLGESSIGWVPFVLERMDYEVENYRGHVTDMPASVMPSEAFRRNVWVTFQDEKLGVRLIPEIGEDNVMWASDYPHADGTFPHSAEAVDRIFAGSSPQIKRKATRDNARRLYGIKG